MSFSTCSSFIGFCFASSPIALPPLPTADPVRRQKQAKSAPLPCARFGREWRLATRRGVLVGGGGAVGAAGGRFQRAGGEGGAHNVGAPSSPLPKTELRRKSTK